MDQNVVAAYENIRFYKFYPVATPDTPDVSNVKVWFFSFTKTIVYFLFIIYESVTL